jgi:DNA-directed RNA polymerase specialized sigma24 family protein
LELYARRGIGTISVASENPRSVMVKAHDVAQHLPYLRRYARALTGSQTYGDVHVAATLEELVKQPDQVEGESSLRVALFRLFSRLWNSQAVDGERVIANVAPGERHLSHMTEKPRQAFLLVSVEGFSEEEAARILDLEVPALRALVEEAGRELAAQIATDVLIIEDEALIALDLKTMVENLGHKVVGMARTRSEAVAIARAKPPGLILADMQLADGSSGLDAINDLLATFEVPVIFITAYPERLLTGERPEPAFLVSKPYQAASVSALISQALFFESNARLRTKRAS